LLSDSLQSKAIDRSEFTNLTRSIVRHSRPEDSTNIPTRLDRAVAAASEALRHVYQLGSMEQLLVAPSPEEIESVEFEAFSEWLTAQRDGLRNSVLTASPSESPSGPSASSPVDNCAPARNVRVENLTVDHHGWGNQSIILLENGYGHEPGVPPRIENTALRNLCQGALHRNELNGRVACFHWAKSLTDAGWLVMYATKDPPVDLQRYAQAIAKSVEADGCLHPGLRLLVVNFSNQQ
jgi:hypothetical protein